MGKKSSKKTENNPNPNPNIFNQLFGETLIQQPDSSSLFSSENPFRRKIDENPQIENPNPNPKKRVDEESSNISLSGMPEKGKKLKVVKLGKSQSGEKSVISDGVGLEEKKGKKNKRKRDELEREYEAKKYGVVKGGEKKEEEVEKVVGKKRKADELMAVPKEGEEEEEGYDDESKLLRTVFVGNLPLKAKKKGLLKEFSKFGEIDSVRIRSVPTVDSKKPKKVMIYNGKLNEAADSIHAYIVFKTEEAAEASLGHNMSVVEGNHIRVDRACLPRKKLKGESKSTTLYSTKRTIFVGNLPFDVKDEELYQLFCGIKEVESSVEAVRVIRDSQTSLGKGIAYVLFKTREAANLVCKKRKLKLRDRELRISHAKPETSSTPSKTEDSTPSKRKTDFDSENTPPVKKLSSGKKTYKRQYNLNPQGDTSYQGFRASKTGDKNRTTSKSSRSPAPFRPEFKKEEKKVKQRSEKRPSVEARKRKILAMASKSAGSKRKMDVRTPQSSSSNQKKKFWK